LRNEYFQVLSFFSFLFQNETQQVYNIHLLLSGHYDRDVKINAARLDTAANMLKAIAQPMRIAIMKHLDRGKKLTVTEIMNYWNRTIH